LVVTELEVNGLHAMPDGAELSLDTFATIRIRRMPTEDLDGEWIRRLQESHNMLINQIDPDDCLEGTDEETLILPVSSLEFVELDKW
jgi:hypothetical protein